MAAIPLLHLATMQGRFPIVDPKTGIPMTDFIDSLNATFANIESIVNTQDATIDRLRRVLSHTVPTTIAHAVDTGVNATLSIDGHTRVFGDGTTQAIAGSALTGLASDTTFALYYDDPTLENGSPTFHATTNLPTAQAIAAEGRFFLGVITTPAAGSGKTVDGGGVYAMGSNIGGELD